MVKKKSTHVVPNSSKGGWDVKQSGSQKSSGHFDTKKEAEKRGRDLSKKQSTELVIHNKDGKISRKDSHGNDPHPPKG
ncbi:MAG: DUF2188 domain-containing protein [Bacteroidales bacterium]|nr:DUF2188 domain-containing protein [Bacteroidales bacterium]